MVSEAAEIFDDDDDVAVLLTSVFGGTTNSVRVALRMIRSDGTPYSSIEEAFDHSAGDRTTETFSMTVPTGKIVGISVTTEPGAKRGQIYVRLFIRRNGRIHLRLGRGYVYDLGDWAMGQNDEPGPGGGEGNIRSIQIADPAAGVELSETVPTNALWRPVSLVAPVVGGAADFFPTLDITDGTNVKWRSKAVTVTGAASETNIYSRGSAFVEASLSTIPLVDILMPEAYVISTGSITGDDDYGVGELLVEEWLVI